ncbi:MAG: hypothetical protein ACP5DX_12240 [Paracoccaceae bacterium]
MTKERACAISPAVPEINRRTVLLGTPALATTAALPSVSNAATIKEQIEYHANSLAELLRSYAPDGAGSVVCHVSDNWYDRPSDAAHWNASTSFFRLDPLPNGRSHWISEGTKHLDPRLMEWR